MALITVSVMIYSLPDPFLKKKNEGGQKTPQDFISINQKLQPKKWRRKCNMRESKLSYKIIQKQL